MALQFCKFRTTESAIFASPTACRRVRHAVDVGRPDGRTERAARRVDQLWLKTAPAGDVRIAIQDASGTTKMMREIRDDLNAAADSINQIELIRSQLGTLTSVLGADASANAMRTAADDLDKKLMAVEENLFQMRVTGRGQDVFRWGPRFVTVK